MFGPYPRLIECEIYGNETWLANHERQTRNLSNTVDYYYAHAAIYGYVFVHVCL